MKQWQIYQAELLKPAHPTRNNHGYLILSPEERDSDSYVTFVRGYDSIDKLVKLTCKEGAKASFPEDKGIITPKGKIFRFRPVNLDLYEKICAHLKG